MKFPKIILKACCFIKKKGRVFLVRYPDNEGNLDLWDLPGKIVDKEQNIGKRVEREVLENTGLLVKIIAPKLFIEPETEYPVKEIDHRTYKGRMTFILINEAVIISGKPAIRSEGGEFRWVKLQDINKREVTSTVKKAVDFFLDKKRSKPFSPVTI